MLNPHHASLHPNRFSRRAFLRSSLAAALAGPALSNNPAFALLPRNPLGQRPDHSTSQGVEILNPRARVPLSFFIDDSTCLVNMGRFCMPQFAEAWPTREIYNKPWRTWPAEIPDAFLREFGEFCAAHGVRGKFSIVPYPACVGWLDRELPGWSRRDLQASLKLVRELMAPNWDIHPEMISHTRVIDIKTGRPFAEIGDATMENSFPQRKISVDELAAYLAYALRILKNCDLPCEGITTPGGFGSKAQFELGLAAREAVTSIFNAEIPHYFKYVADGAESTQPLVEHVSDLDTAHPKVVVNVPAGTGDWFGNWDGDAVPQPDRYATADASAGRLVELIERGDPAVMLCHWPGLYGNGSRAGFEACKRVILSLNARYGDRTHWMKISELARYWAAKELTRIERQGERITLTAPFACPDFTLRLANAPAAPPRLTHQGQSLPLHEVRAPRDLKPGTWLREKDHLTLCFNLPKGLSECSLAPTDRV